MKIRIFLVFQIRNNDRNILVDILRNNDGWIQIDFSFEGDAESCFSFEITDVNYQDFVKALKGIESIL